MRIQRPYQHRLALDIGRSLAIRGPTAIVQLPTGAGKTVVQASLSSRMCDRGRKCLHIVPSIEILKQTLKAYERQGVLDVMPLGGGYKEDGLRYAQIVVAMSQTLKNRFLDLDPSLIHADELHRLLDQHLDIARRWPNAIRLGWTATPMRYDGKKLSDWSPNLVCGPSIPAMTRAGYLIPAHCFTAPLLDTSLLRKRRGEYVTGDVEEAFGDKLSLVPKAWSERAWGRRTIVFAVSVAHSKSLVQEFAKIGVPAAHLDANSDPDERTRLLEELAAGTIRVLCNVGLFVEGLDLIEVESIVLATATNSLSRYLQMVGRGLRPSPKTGKKMLIVLDHGQHFERLGFPDEDRDWSRGGILTGSDSVGVQSLAAGY